MGVNTANFPNLSRIDKDDAAYALDENGNICRVTCDAETHRLLGLLSGTVNTTPTVFNITLGIANTEQSQALPANTKEFIIKSRGNTELKLAYTIAESGSKFISVGKNGVYTDSNFYTAQTIYFQSPQATGVIEIIAFV